MSALTNEVGLVALQIDPIPLANIGVSYSALAVMDASTEKIGLIGCVWHPTVKTGTTLAGKSLSEIIDYPLVTVLLRP